MTGRDDAVVASEPYEEFGMQLYRAKFKTKWEGTPLGKSPSGGSREPEEVEYIFEKEYGKWKLVR